MYMYNIKVRMILEATLLNKVYFSFITHVLYLSSTILSVDLYCSNIQDFYNLKYICLNTDNF